jgi:hypothetical protein
MTEIEEREEPYGWYTLHRPPTGVLTSAQERTIREVAAEFGYENLRGFHMYLRSQSWDYYDILQIKYGE